MQNTKNIFIDPKRRTPGKGKSSQKIQSFSVFEQQSLTLESVNVTVWWQQSFLSDRFLTHKNKVW